MAHPRKRHYRAAQKAVEAQAVQHEDEHRRDSVIMLMFIMVLITQLFSIAVRIFQIFNAGDTQSFSD